MQHRDDHLDEGTIHAWLDGALGADEARAVEAHVAGCESCAAAVAEARGLIAAASGILAKLDAVPAGVVPRGSSPAAPLAARDANATVVVPIDVARRERGRAPWWSSRSLRVAAGLLVVATGTVVVVREQGTSRERAESVVGFSVNRSEEPAAARTTATAGAPTAAPAAAPIAPPPPPPLTVRPEPGPRREVASAPPVADTTTVAAAPPVAAPAPSPLASRAVAAPAPAVPTVSRATVGAMVGATAGGAGAASMDSSAPVAQSLAARDARSGGRIGERSANVADAAAEPAMAAKSVNEGARQLTRRRSAEAPPAAPVAAAAIPAVSMLANRAAGCYELQSGRWTPAEPRLVVPERLALDTAPATTTPPGESPRQGGLVARAIGPAAAAAWRTGYWTPLGGDSVRVLWSDGTTVVELRARLVGDTLRGRASTFPDDVRRGVQQAALTATRAACGVR